jgi:membrane dipeptidase
LHLTPGRALCDAPRNMTDDMLRAVANSGGPNSKGGVVQVNFFSGFVSQAYRDARRRRSPKWKRPSPTPRPKPRPRGKEFTYSDEEKIQRSYMDRIPRPPLSMLIDHIDHIAKVAGVDHVGLGSDFDGVSGQLPEGLDSPADLPKITQALLDRGYSAEDCRKILGGNLLRVFREVEAVSKNCKPKIDPGSPTSSRSTSRRNS